MSEVRKNTDGAGASNESHHQTMVIQRLGHGHDRQNQPPPSSKGHQYILAIMDYFTKWVEAIPMKTVSSKDVINFIKEHVIDRFGIPQTITTDGGSVFISEEFRKFVADVGIKLIRSSPYDFQANGQAEASNQSLIKLIKRKIDEHPRR
jgi:transposase InsO family protein